MAALDNLIPEIADKTGLTSDAVRELAKSLIRGKLRRATFNHPDLGGVGAWMHGEVIIGNMADEALRVAIWQTVEQLIPALEGVPEKIYKRDDDTLLVPWWGDMSLGTPAVHGLYETMTFGYFLLCHRVIVKQGDLLLHYDASGLRVTDIRVTHKDRGMPVITLRTLDGDVTVDELPLIEG